MCVTKLDVTKLRGSVEVREEEEVHAGYRSKNKNPTRFCVEKRSGFMMLIFLSLHSRCHGFLAFSMALSSLSNA